MGKDEQVIFAGQEEAEAARTAATLLSGAGDAGEVRLRREGPEGPAEVRLPACALRALARALEVLASRDGVTLSAVRREMTAQQAADFLGMSRPVFIRRYLESGRIPYRMVGNRRKVRVADLRKYLDDLQAERERWEREAGALRRLSDG